VSSAAADGAVLALCALAVVLADLRWLRVAQREHYLPGAASVFAWRWWGSSAANRALAVVGLAGALVSARVALAGLAGALAGAAGPLGLSLRGRTSRLAWTSRLRRLAVLLGVVQGVALATAALATWALAGSAGAALHGAATACALLALAAPATGDLAMWAARPLEARSLGQFVRKAAQHLRASAPRIVAITGSYGKTTTKGYVAHLLSGQFSVVATPASFNNTAGLSRAVNEHLVPGTQVFVAEMGTYGPGEIAAMCAWAPPEVAVITAIGPVHLERMRTLERIADAKAEILERAPVAVLNVDHPLLARLADRAEAEGRTVWRCSASAGGADVSVRRQGDLLRVVVPRAGAGLDLVVGAGPEVEPGNVACALAVAFALGVPPEAVGARLATLPVPPHRRVPQRGAGGADVVDDTYNSNPAGAAGALAMLGQLGAPGGRKVVVTPGMVELGPAQEEANREFAARAGQVATELVVVGRTNARALEAGARQAGLAVRRVADRQAAVAWVKAHLGPGDAVLYENDLPDHYP
jgi:UDP-N-acetylmuramoyl-tripeptide--D-alanyl-D-alanine ligase